MGSWFQKLEERLGGGPGGSKRIRTFRWLILIGLVGCALMILNSFHFLRVKDVDPLPKDQASPPAGEVRQTFSGSGGKEPATFRDYQTAYESQLKDILNQIVGVGDPEVMVTIDSTEELTVEKNTKDTQQTTNEKDTNGATRHITDVTRSSDAVMVKKNSEESPLVVKTIAPKIRGVVVVAKGAENATIKQLIVEAVERGLDVSPNRISVVPRKQ